MCVCVCGWGGGLGGKGKGCHADREGCGMMRHIAVHVRQVHPQCFIARSTVRSHVPSQQIRALGLAPMQLLQGRQRQ